MRGCQINAAIEFLVRNVTEAGMPSNEIYRRAGNIGITRRTLERAKLALGVRSKYCVDRWDWVMPENGCVHEESSDFRPGLPAIYFRHQKQLELTMVETYGAHLPEEIYPLDMSEIKRIFLICGLSKFLGKFDSFALRVPREWEANIVAGDAFVFCNWSRTQVSVLQWQGDGFAQYFKRSEYGQFPWPVKKDVQAIEIRPEDLNTLLEYPRLMMRLSGISVSENLAQQVSKNADIA